jgi:prepilin-type N-terminal cleavage/methylation domain-containing protein
MDKKIHVKKQSGFTLIEILIASVIIAIVAGIVGPLLTEVKDKNVTVSQEIALMRATLANIDDRYWDEAITTDLDNAELMAGSILPIAYKQSGTEDIFSLFGGSIFINGVDEDGLTWLTEGVPNGVCTKFIDDAKSLGFETAIVSGGGTVTYSTDKNADFTVACGTDDSVDITFTRASS